MGKLKHLSLNHLAFCLPPIQGNALCRIPREGCFLFSLVPMLEWKNMKHTINLVLQMPVPVFIHQVLLESIPFQ